jgi:hypothetical protein
VSDEIKAASELATAKLEAISAALHPAPPASPTTPTEARARLDHLTTDKQWAAKFEAGDADTRREFDTLTALVAEARPGDRLDDVLAGTATLPLIETVTAGQLPTIKLMSAVDGLREAGISGDAIRQAVNGVKVSRIEYEAGKQLHAQRVSDAEWRKRLLAGDASARREMTLMSIVLSSEIAEA